MKKILIAEDDFYVLDIYKTAFIAAGYEVDTAEDGEKVLEKLKANTYDVMLVDIMLPKMSGTEIINWCRAENSPAKKLLIYAITNLDEEVFIKKVMAAGANGYFVKANMTPQSLVEQIDTALRIQK
ncbi:MAG TPA: response regulator [Candidatus Saccharimonadales bacterium]|nr:response regulator [Candidatus Saccharimonadales bacterium]